MISCSNALNAGVLKNSARVMPKPSHIILMVRSFGFWLLPYSMFLMLDGGNAQMVASLLMLMSFLPHNSRILFLTAVTVSINKPLPNYFLLAYTIWIDFIGYVCYYWAMHSRRGIHMERQVCTFYGYRECRGLDEQALINGNHSARMIAAFNSQTSGTKNTIDCTHRRGPSGAD